LAYYCCLEVCWVKQLVLNIMRGCDNRRDGGTEGGQLGLKLWLGLEERKLVIGRPPQPSVPPFRRMSKPIMSWYTVMHFNIILKFKS
jgi:hypothetical protein